MVEVRKELKEKPAVKPMGEKMVKLIVDIQNKFKKKYNFTPTIKDTTDMIAEKIRRKGIRVI